MLPRTHLRCSSFFATPWPSAPRLRLWPPPCRSPRRSRPPPMRRRQLHLHQPDPGDADLAQPAHRSTSAPADPASTGWTSPADCNSSAQRAADHPSVQQRRPDLRGDQRRHQRPRDPPALHPDQHAPDDAGRGGGDAEAGSALRPGAPCSSGRSAARPRAPAGNSVQFSSLFRGRRGVTSGAYAHSSLNARLGSFSTRVWVSKINVERTPGS